MLKVRLRKSGTEMWQFIVRQYRNEIPGPFCDEDVLDWALDKGFAELPEVNPRAILRRDLKRALRASRMSDPQGRKVRVMVPIKQEAIDANGNRVFRVV